MQLRTAWRVLSPRVLPQQKARKFIASLAFRLFVLKGLSLASRRESRLMSLGPQQPVSRLNAVNSITRFRADPLQEFSLSFSAFSKRMGFVHSVFVLSAHSAVKTARVDSRRVQAGVYSPAYLRSMALYASR
jgi:hypothetical protein